MLFKKKMREQTIIDQLLRPLTANAPYALELRDDAALMHVPEGQHLVITTDMLQEGVHFLRDGTPSDIAWKALATNLSDVAAMGATPHSYQLAVALTAAQDESWLRAFCDTLLQMQQHFLCALSGGDTIRSNAALTISITAHGLVPMGQALFRTGAQVGDTLCVSGTLSDAAIGLAILQGKLRGIPDALATNAIARYWRPTPRLALGEALRGMATACMDISDGLMIDCKKLCIASRVGATIAYDALPLSDVGYYVKIHHPEWFARCISAGDDYELLCTLPSHVNVPFGLTPIGKITEKQEVHLTQSDGTNVTLSHKGYEH